MKTPRAADIGQTCYLNLATLKAATVVEGVVEAQVAHDYFLVRLRTKSKKPVFKLRFGNEVYANECLASMRAHITHKNIRDKAIDKAVAVLHELAPHLLIGE